MGRPPLALGTAGKVRTYRTISGWKARTLVRDYDGLSRPIERTAKTDGAARRLLAEAVRDRGRTDGRAIITRETKVADLGRAWFEQVEASGLSPSTLQLYRDRLDKQILPALGNVRVRELSVGLIDRHLAAVRAKHGASLAKATKSVLSGMCRLACRHDAMVANPCREVARISTKPKSSPTALGVVELRQLLAFLTYDDLAAEHDLPDLVGLLSATGLRIGEACALSWDAVDLNRGTIEVQATVIRVRGEGLVVRAQPKSKAGGRILELPAWCVELLRNKRREARGNLVLPSKLGHLRDPSNTRRAMQQAFRRAGYVGLTSHTMRKSVATIMDQAGLSSRAAADQLGHANVSMTTDVYMARKVRHTGAAEVLEDLRLSI